jgi:transcriptional regulator of acetoin/glycerol metabolism
VSRREIELSWERFVVGGRASDAVRPLVDASWTRSSVAGVSPSLARAERVLGDDQLVVLRRSLDWFPFAEPLTHGDAHAAPGHIVSFFDLEGHLIACAGDPRVSELASEVNFAPGGLWTENAVGTNGPGTALATGTPVYIIGPEHYCQAWHGWHCAAVPLHDPMTGQVIGAVDVSSNTVAADPHPQTMHLVKAMALAVEAKLHSAALARRLELLEAFFALASRYSSERAVVIDRSGFVVAASQGVPEGFRAGEIVPAARLTELVATEAAPGSTTVQPLVAHGERIGAFALFPSTSLAAPGARPRAPRETATTRYACDDLAGASRAIVDVRCLVASAGRNDLPVLVLGESGVGKEVVAQSIHASSPHRDGPFIAVNCGALAPALVESELFGYAPGAFTGAQRHGAPGKFEAANGGTIFLDELGELPASAQAALLRVLEEREITRVGESRSRRVDVRIIAATNRTPQRAIDEGLLRRDLYYRLAVLVCELPPLRERIEDLPLLVDAFVVEACAEVGRGSMQVAPEVLDAFRAYAWPGNVRELKNLVRRLAATTVHDVVTRGDLPAELRAAVADPGAQHDRVVEDDDLARVRDAIARSKTMNEAARRLGIGRSSLYRLLERMELRVARTLRRN